MKQNTTSNSNQATKERIDPAVLKVALILVVGGLAPLFDTTIMNVALDSLARNLHAPISTIQWVMTGYLLALGMTIPITGWASDRCGGKNVWLFSLLVFLGGSVLSGLSWNIDTLIAFRVLQGIGAGMMTPIMMTLIVQAAGGRRLSNVIAIVGLPALLGPILGPVIGGLILDHLSWRWLFYVNVPICVAAFLLAWFGLPSTNSGQTNKRLDYVGLILVSPALIALLYGLGGVSTYGGFAHASVYIPIAIGVLLLVIFTGYALWAKGNSLIDLRLFRIRSFSSSSIVLFLSGLTTYGTMLLLPLFYQQVFKESTIATGLLLIPQGIGSLLVRSWVGKVCERIGSRLVVVISTALVVTGTLPFALGGPHSSQVLLEVSQVVVGAGRSGVFIPVMTTAYQGLGREQVSHASSASRIMQQIGGAFGAAVLAVILDNQLATHAATNMAALTSAFQYTFWWVIGLSVIGFIPALFLPGRVRRAND